MPEHDERKRFFFRINEDGIILENVSLDEIDSVLDKKHPVNMFRYSHIREKLEVEEDYSSSIRTSENLYCLPNFKIYYIKRIK